MTRKMVVVFVAGVMVGLLPMVVQTLMDGYHRSTAQATAAQCRALSKALENYKRDHGDYPPLGNDIRNLETQLVPKYLIHVPTKSIASGEPLLVVLHGERAAVVATGKYGIVVEDERFVGEPSWQ